jgi:starch synthase (maltosyl-transferring)
LPKEIPGDQLDRRLSIEAVSPSVDGGRFAVKRIVGERCVVEADIYRDSHDVIRAALRWRRASQRRGNRKLMEPIGNDRWRASFELSHNELYFFQIEAWTDPFATWLEDLRKRVKAGMTEVASEIKEGIAMLEDAAPRASAVETKILEAAIGELRSLVGSGAKALAVAEDVELARTMERLNPRTDLLRTRSWYQVRVDRPRARFASWYEMFVRSQGTVPGKSGTFADAERRLPEIREMGFDVVYLAPIHPIGRTNRKGPNNKLLAEPGDPGSPWAIGSAYGDHTAIEPTLGTLDDFDRFVSAANELGMEIALDFAIQCSPDHPWVSEHPEWFQHRPDGSIKYAENPPKKYQDIYPVNFDNPNAAALWEEIRQVLLFWIGRGVKIFRVDNPHTKPFSFWKWLIGRIKDEHPDVIFLSEAFTRPKIMKALAKVGFTQSYTYFTWRNSKAEMAEYLTELTQTEMAEYFGPNFFTNTPDILHEVLQKGGRPAFQFRLILAATLSPSYGIYSGFELCENEAVPGTEEYKDSEKYQLKVWDWDRPGNIKPYIARVNRIRHQNAALQELRNVKFYDTDNENILFYRKFTTDRSNIILVAVNFDAFHPHHTTVRVPLKDLGVAPGGRFIVRDLLTDETFEWGDRNFVRLDPETRPAHILRVERLL